jgi:hypothetical protein
MDAFYASVEQRDRPELRGRPVIVGADPRGRGVVSACSYEARVFGVHSAMPISKAARLCPQAAFLPVDMDKYVAVSRQIMAILETFSPLVEAISVDEAFIDLTGTTSLFGPPPEAAMAIKRRIRADTGLTASAGLAANKFVAKVASDLRKPDGFVVVEPGREAEFLAPLEVTDLSVESGYKRIRLAGGREVVTFALVIATGMTYREQSAGDVAVLGRGRLLRRGRDRGTVAARRAGLRRRRRELRGAKRAPSRPLRLGGASRRAAPRAPRDDVPLPGRSDCEYAEHQAGQHHRIRLVLKTAPGGDDEPAHRHAHGKSNLDCGQAPYVVSKAS